MPNLNPALESRDQKREVENIPKFQWHSNSSLSMGKLAEASSTFGRLLEIVDKSGVSGEVSSGDLDEFKSFLLELDSTELNR